MLSLIKSIKICTIPSGVTAPQGFLAHAVKAGIRKKDLDLGLKEGVRVSLPRYYREQAFSIKAA